MRPAYRLEVCGLGSLTACPGAKAGEVLVSCTVWIEEGAGAKEVKTAADDMLLPTFPSPPLLSATPPYTRQLSRCQIARQEWRVITRG